MTARVKGWSNVRASRCRAAHYVAKDADGVYRNLTVALCGSPIRTLSATKQHTREVCDHCQREARKGVR